ncbi:endonuclease/exonuclease/phosphatase family protein [Bacillus haynesii]|uniref:endonuclease/exonuclease/phosphatase family protein n=1 Tax=Bacillus haynesii TaxID=1925021 RepID=UPI002DBBBC53|nr:endonuclease/exonuclease/phosphatase family protein [Bacillus haynesii]MEC1478168.1 endonuclease/exonuclease/phosphatase family protein [Bacillus haynesii]
MKFGIMTFNIHHGKGRDRRVDLERTAGVIAQSGCDIIGLNEVDQHYSNRSDYEDQIGRLAEQLNMHYAYCPSLSLSSDDSSVKRQYGNALLTRFPIVKEQHHSFNFVKGLVEGRSLLEADVRIGDRLFRVFVTHLSLNPWLHGKQTDFLIERVQESDLPVIVMGDFNMKPYSRGWKKVGEKLADLWDESQYGHGFTYPSHRPRRRLDYIFLSPSFHVTAAEVVAVDPSASDHLPLKGSVTY